MEKLLGEFSVGLFIWQSFIFIGLVLLLRKFAWKPILESINERETSISNALSEAEQARKEMAAIKDDNQRVLKEARAEREALLKEARQTGSQLVDQAKEDAKQEAQKIVAQAQDAIKSEKQAAINDLKAQVASISVEIAEKMVHNELENKDKQLALVDKLLENVSLK